MSTRKKPDPKRFAGSLTFPSAVMPLRVYAAALLNDWCLVLGTSDNWFSVEDGVVYQHWDARPKDSPSPIGPLPNGWDAYRVEGSSTIDAITVCGPAAAIAQLLSASEALDAAEERLHGILFGEADAIVKAFDLPAFIAKRKAVKS